jgi:hypothetical protein
LNYILIIFIQAAAIGRFQQITELSAHIHAATYRLLELIREYDDSHGWAGPGLNSCAHWLNWRCGINLGAART